MKRKIIQIALCPIGATGVEIFALCDDGTLWKKHGYEEFWNKYKGVPQDGEEKA
jgi:hypothetical protein